MAGCREKKRRHSSAERKQQEEIEKADLEDDGGINGSAAVNSEHGTTVKDLATGTTLEGKAKGEAIRDAARSKARNGSAPQEQVNLQEPGHQVLEGQLAGEEVKIYYEFNPSRLERNSDRLFLSIRSMI